MASSEADEARAYLSGAQPDQPQGDDAANARSYLSGLKSEKPRETTSLPPHVEEKLNLSDLNFNVPGRVQGAFRKPDPEAAEQTSMGVMQGAADIGNTLLNLAHVDIPGAGGLSKEEREKELATYQQDYGNSGRATAGRIGSNVLLTAPLLEAGGTALAGVPVVSRAVSLLKSIPGGITIHNMITGATQGGAASAMLSGGSTQPVGEQIRTGAELGGVLSPVLPAAVGYASRKISQLGQWIAGVGGRVVRGLVGDAPAAAPEANRLTGVDPTGQVESALKARGVDPATISDATHQKIAAQAKQQLQTSGVVDADSLARIANADKWGFHTTMGMATRDGNMWARERLLATQPGGESLDAAYKFNDQKAAQHLDGFSKVLGGQTHDPYEAGQSVIDSVLSKWEESQGEVGKLYDQVRKTSGNKAGLYPEKLLSEFNDLSDNAELDTLTTSVKRRMQRMGILDSEGKVAAAGPNSEKIMSVSQAEDLRKFVSGLGTDSPTTRLGKARLVDALDDDVLSTTKLATGTGTDAFAEARGAARQRFQEFKDNGLIQNIVDMKVDPDTMMKRFVIGAGGKSSTAESLWNLQRTLQTGTPEQVTRGTQAWNNLRGQVADWIKNQSVLQNGAVSFNGLKDAMNRIGPQKMRVLFGEDGAREYGSLAQAIQEATVPPARAPVNVSGTAPMLSELARMGSSVPFAFMSPTAATVTQAGQKLLGPLIRRKEVNQLMSGSTVKPEDLALPPSANEFVNQLTRKVTPAAASSIRNQ